MDRRRYLALVGSGVTLSIAGCAGDDGDDGSDEGTDDGGGEPGSDDSGGNTGSDNANNEDSTDYAGLVWVEETEFVPDSNRFIAGDIVGTVLNDTGEETYVEAEATLYSEDGAVVGKPILDNISGLEQGQRWEFGITVYESNWARYEVEVTTGF